MFHRLRQVKNSSVLGNPLIVEYRYDGLGRRIGEHYDVNSSGTVDSSDVWFYFVYDDQWRVIATFRDGDNDGTAMPAKHNPKEQFVYHCDKNKSPPLRGGLFH